ncbi:hypothetical protein [Nocardioides panzhihuensis]|uniref:Uncharacterized protein n=1 Tax=Nocardioides panzhihuensis TaxID=860243 RepID=A0A7Z0DQP5_9ACTN|nr:hypothetical protein [Nocardioides panzhihuensis]NYI79875.1 hypothetical protein [Nocardioides panzhihuensis]
MVLAVAVGACGGSGGGSGDVASPSAAAKGSATSTESSSASQLAEVNGARFTAPAGWEVEQGESRILISAPEDDLGYSPGFGLLDADITFSEDTQTLAASVMKQPGARRLRDVEFGGVRFFHVREGNDTNTSTLTGQSSTGPV